MLSLRLCVMVTMWGVVWASGHFELQIISIQNRRGELADGDCCEGTTRNKEGLCTQDCNTYVRVCLKEYQASPHPDGPCTLGNLSSAILGGKSFTYPLNSNASRLDLPFDFAWTVSIYYVYMELAVYPPHIVLMTLWPYKLIILLQVYFTQEILSHNFHCRKVHRHRSFTSLMPACLSATRGIRMFSCRIP